MALPAVPQLKKEYLEMIPDFHGDVALLPRFIEICEKLVTKFYNVADPTDFQNEYLTSSILAKIKGEAAINISSCSIKTWENLKDALFTYADKRDVYTLSIEITHLKQGNESPFEFFQKIQHLLNLQISLLQTRSNRNEQEILGSYFRNLALRVLLRGLKEPLGTFMRTKNPNDMNTALNVLTNDFQIYMGQNNSPKNQNPSSSNNFSNKNKSNSSNYVPPNNFNFQNNNYQRNNNYSQFPKNQYQSTQTRNFNNNQNQPNTSRTSNVFRPNQNQNLPNPTPMTISTNNTFRPNQNYQNRYKPRSQNQSYFARQPQNIIQEELHNIDEINNSDDKNVYQEDNDHFLEEIASDQVE
ncbi:putative mediator of RNA polymerase II transcription subunit 24 [Diabrotica virgifera virgifera]|uniref:GATA zinc finger domain-containing protein 14-like n=1 Tax=Diabrotica virgifera virgifera TaxID=50390 RepID=A0ABM5KXU5_DIAVI|nr:putative mediator of RNA polymerase II transcription subunit 24 [Diabrotica virgifera virgifera]